MTCCIDNRRLPFFAAYISAEDSNLADTGEEKSQDRNDDTITGSTRLMLFLEIVSFRDLFGVTPTHRRLFAANKIAYKFLLSQPQEGSDTMVNPQFDIRSMIPSEILRTVENCLKKEEISHELFCDVEECLKKSFGGMKFASFLLSDECARMRAYMRGTSPYQDPALECLYKNALDTTSENFSFARNHLEYIIVYLLCQSENDALDKNYTTNKEASDIDGGKRVMGAAGGICCALFIKRVLMPSIQKAKELLLQNQMNEEMDKVGQTLIDSYSSFWECFIAPSGGTLEFTILSNDAQMMLDKVRRSVKLATSPPRNFSQEERRRHIVRSLALNNDLSKSLLRLVEELMYDYAVNMHTKYRGHTVHEWMCVEVNKAQYVKKGNSEEIKSETETLHVEDVPKLPSGCISRLLRRLDFPEGLSRHCPEVKSSSTTNQPTTEQKVQPRSRLNADFAVVFGSDNGRKVVGDGRIPNDISSTHPTLHRFACIPVSDKAKGGNADGGMINPANEVIPPTLESYIHVPLLGERQFQQVSDAGRMTVDGWEVSLVNFMIPCNKNDDKLSSDGFLYGVSLVLNFNTEKELPPPETTTIEFVEDKTHKITWTQEKDMHKLSIFIDSKVDAFNQVLRLTNLSTMMEKQKETAASSEDDSTSCITLGIALISYQNVIPSMRKSLSRCFGDISTIGLSNSTQALAAPLSSILECFRIENNADASVLSSLLDPYLDFGHSSLSNPSISNSHLDQKEMFESAAIEALTESIPPIPLALLFITALLEQKIIFTSRRRSCLLSMSVALKTLLSPLEWSHLFVPVVPAGLATDLVQYPAPFILGIPFSPSTMSLLKSIPDDVTIVDVDVGRVILAKTFSVNLDAQNDEENNISTTIALRSQVLHLAETLGAAIGSCESQRLWTCDSPFVDSVFTTSNAITKGKAVQKAIRSFLRELLAGCNTCCFLIEEAPSSVEDKTEKECSVLFDEDRFFHLKYLRSKGTYIPLFNDEDYFISSPSRQQQPQNHPHHHQRLDRHHEMIDSKLDTQSSFALNLDHFNLIVETFLRGQLLSVHLSSRCKETMSFW